MGGKPLLLPALIAQQARQDPERTFVQEVGGASLTLAAFNDAVLRWADAYRRLGVAAGDRVVTMLPASAAASCAWLGLTWRRAIEVPCNVAYRGRMLGYLADNAEAETMVIADRYLPQLAEVIGDLKHVQTVVVVGGDHDDVELPCRVVEENEFFAEAMPADDLPEPELSDICALFYTSGTTGPSKGVLSPWGQIYVQATTVMPLEDLVDGEEAWYMPYPMHHIAGKSPVFTMALVNGRVVIRERFDTGAFWADIDEFSCTCTALLGSMQAFLWQQEPRDDDADHALRNVMMYPLLPQVDEFKRRFDLRVGTSYGATEQGPAIHAGWNTSSANWRSSGRLRQGYPGWQARVVDDRDYEVGPGEVGELIVRTSEPWTINAGYFGRPEKTVEAWRNGWFHTGDAFTYDDDGNFYFVDRVNDCIRRRGENISSFEVEAEVNAHPMVQESAAVGVPSEFGEEDVKVLVVTQPGESLAPEELIEFLTPRMPRFMVPRYVEFVAEIPKTEATLRVKKYLLREKAVNDATWDRERGATIGAST
jgi:carnitine-CoA ligase